MSIDLLWEKQIIACYCLILYIYNIIFDGNFRRANELIRHRTCMSYQCYIYCHVFLRKMMHYGRFFISCKFSIKSFSNAFIFTGWKSSLYDNRFCRIQHLFDNDVAIQRVLCNHVVFCFVCLWKTVSAGRRSFSPSQLYVVKLRVMYVFLAKDLWYL